MARGIPGVLGGSRRWRVHDAVVTRGAGYAGIVTILLSVTLLDLVHLEPTGYNNLYYAAGVRSMLTSWHNLFFVAFDPGGFVSLDKPPLGLWIQAMSAKLFGFSGVSLILPQAVAGILSVGLLYQLVRRTCGEVAGLLSALFLAISPINVATNRNNTIDAQLVLVLLGAAWAVTRASEQASRRWLMLAFALVGVGFNIKMLQAYLVLPAFVAVYLLTANIHWRRRVLDLALATSVLLLVSLSWVIVVDATPASQRPFVGGSGNNRELNLLIGHNGIARLVGAPASQQAHDIGNPGPLRFLERQFAGQISWFLPLAFVGLLIFLAARPWSRHHAFDRQRQATMLWGAWLIIQLVFFSGATFFHLYYLVMASPAIAALAGITMSIFWQRLTQPRWYGLLAVTLAVTAALHCWIVSGAAGWMWWIAPPVLGLTVVSIGGLMVSGTRPGRVTGRLPAVAATLGVVGMLIGPAVWAALPVWNARSTSVPIAGPASARGHQESVDPGAVAPTVAYLHAHRAETRYIVATLTSFSAAPLIIATGQPVMTIGGYKGRDATISVNQLEAAVTHGMVRYFLVPPDNLTPPGKQPYPADQIGVWVRKTCTAVPSGWWQSSSMVGDAPTADVLYDCSVPGQHRNTSGQRHR
jgi:4-amino-4-deoxy-L-arabinose transferase-like glycosyltransferase